MKRRLRKIINFFAFNLLFFALYLNFIHKDRTNSDVTTAVTGTSVKSAAYTGTVLVQNPEKYAGKKEVKNQDNQQ
jgi:hypothetical protein